MTSLFVENKMIRWCGQIVEPFASSGMGLCRIWDGKELFSDGNRLVAGSLLSIGLSDLLGGVGSNGLLYHLMGAAGSFLPMTAWSIKMAHNFAYLIALMTTGLAQIWRSAIRLVLG